MLRYSITDRTRLADGYEQDEPARAAALVAQAAQLAARGDIDYLQLREKDLTPAALASLAREILVTLRTHAPGPAHRPKFLINSRADVALAVRADGVHLTSSPGELTPAQVRSLYTSAGLPTPIVSLSCHTLADIVSARDVAPDLILFGPVFEKVIGPNASQSTDQLITEGSGAGTGLALLHQACLAAAPIPVLALGGITPENTPACIAAGAAGIAAIRLFQIG